MWGEISCLPPSIFFTPPFMYFIKTQVVLVLCLAGERTTNLTDRVGKAGERALHPADVN